MAGTNDAGRKETLEAIKAIRAILKQIEKRLDELEKAERSFHLVKFPNAGFDMKMFTRGTGVESDEIDWMSFSQKATPRRMTGWWSEPATGSPLDSTLNSFTFTPGEVEMWSIRMPGTKAGNQRLDVDICLAPP